MTPSQESCSFSEHSPNRTTVRFTRYIGPYVLATAFRKAGFEVAYEPQIRVRVFAERYALATMTINDGQRGLAASFTHPSDFCSTREIVPPRRQQLFSSGMR